MTAAMTPAFGHDSGVDPDWYFDNVLVDAEPGGPPRIERGVAHLWRRWWQRQWDDAGADPAARAARAQGFVLTRDEARHHGLSEADIRRGLSRRTWSRPSRGVLSPVAVPEPVAGDRAAAMLAARRQHALAAAAAALTRPGQVISGRSAAVLLGLPTLAVPSMPELIARAPATAGRHGRALVRTAQLAPDETTSWFGAPVTDLARTVVGLARIDAREGLVAADAALLERLVDRPQIAAALTRAHGWPGVRRAREVLALASPLAESPLESLLRLALHDDGFPPPILQAEIVDHAEGRSYRVDMLWPDDQVVLEADGRVKYTGDALWREKKREHRLNQLGFRVVRVLWSDVMSSWPATGARIRSYLTAPSPA